MIGKNNKYLRSTREGVKVESYSIKKFKVGAASVVIGASIFFGAGIANAGEVSEKNVEVEKMTEGPNSKASTDKEDEKTAKKEELVNTNATTVNNIANTEKAVEKQALDKTKLKINIEKVEELLEKINKEKAPASTLAAIKIDLENAKNIFNSDSTELTQDKIDAATKKLKEKIFILSSMPKANTPEKVVKEGENTIANSGSRDSRNGDKMEEGSNLRSAAIDKTTKRGNLGVVVADSGFITGYATPSSTIEIKRNGQKILTSKLDDTGSFKLNAPGIKVGDRVELVVNGQSVYNTTVSSVDTVSFNDSLAGIAQVDGYTAAEADVEISIGGKKYTTKSQSNGYFTVNVDTKLMVKDATITAVVKKNGKVVGSGTSNVRETRTTDFGVGWNKNPMLNYSERDVFSPDTKQYAFVSVGTADKAYDNIRVYREERRKRWK